ncbi:HlyD family efflux transporter periplasmic adaptor subunit [Exilibacterium tricleocarpae]|uniref:HlyD family efflux transporter periplasmic adaptor subunit n=1 Tax=Exilibacterium tricleocarpae TaxID=2591008 RepID=A0A545SYY8_9GAMM|nr:HlyD family efflux transporter periplasmic adaptor subunit [Exilibacterium tricleocarpae]TQV70177.1 HlyD family efflux transporter periplasmic adaptor subunit [Exilibacterium tricleocarpae]
MIRDTSAQDKAVAPKPKNRLKLAATVALAGVAVTYLALQWAGTSVSVARDSIRTAVVFRDTLVRDINATGRVVATNAPTLYSSATGMITFIKRPGEPVAQGDIVARVRSPELISQLEQEKANLQTAKIELERMRLQGRQEKLNLKKDVDMASVRRTAARRELKRAESSYALRVISTFDYEKARDDLATAELELDNAARAEKINSDMIEFEYQTREVSVERQQLVVDEFERRLRQLTLRAPVNGMMGNWLVDQDSNVSESEPLLIIVDLSAYEGELDIAESYADELAPGMPVEVRIGATNIKAELRSVSPEVINSTVKARVQFLDDSNLNIRQNQRISARVLLESRPDVIQVVKGPFLQAGDFAYVIKDGIAERRPITLGSRSVDKVEIVSGLVAGDEIVTSSVSDFKDHHAIQIN